MAQKAEDSVINANTIKLLTDKLNEKRKLGALEIEQSVKSCIQQKDPLTIQRIIGQISEDLVKNPQQNHKKGGMMALASVAMACGEEELKKYLCLLLQPLFRCLDDQDSRIRYYALEAFYNLLKSSREATMPFFNEIFDSCCRLSADPDQNVKHATVLLDRLVKDIVTQSGCFHMDAFIPLLQKRIYVTNPNARFYIISWLSVLESVPNIELMNHLPAFLDGLFTYLTDFHPDITAETSALLSVLLNQIPKTKDLNFSAIIKIISKYCVANTVFLRITSIQWLVHLIKNCPLQILPFIAEIMEGIINNYAHKDKNVTTTAQLANDELTKLFEEHSQDAPVDEVVRMLLRILNTRAVQTRTAALLWTTKIHSFCFEKLSPYFGQLFPILLMTISDPSDEIVKLDLDLMVKISTNEEYFQRLMLNLLNLFERDTELLTNRAGFIIRLLAKSIDAIKLYCSLANCLENEKNLVYANEIVQILNLLLLTAPELELVRKTLRKTPFEPISSPLSGFSESMMQKSTNLSQLNSNSLGTLTANSSLFVRLYRAWSHSAVATFALCLFSEAYEHACNIITSLTSEDITVSFLLEMDQLVQLIESPIFVQLRLELLRPVTPRGLVTCLHGLLAVLPQGAAYSLLSKRLDAAAKHFMLVASVVNRDESKTESKSESKQVNFEELLAFYFEVQQKHRNYKGDDPKDQRDN